MAAAPAFPCVGRVGDRTFDHVFGVERIGDALLVFHATWYSDYDNPSYTREVECTFWAGGKTGTIGRRHFAHKSNAVYENGNIVGVQYVGRKHWCSNAGCYGYVDPNWCVPGRRGDNARESWSTYCGDVHFEFVRPLDPQPMGGVMMYEMPFDPKQFDLLRYVIARGS